MNFQYTKLTVKSVFSKDILCLTPDTILSEAIDRMINEGYPEVLIVDEKNFLLGIFSYQDLSLRLSKTCRRDLPIKIFVKKEVISTNEDMTLSECRDIMLEKKIGRLPVLKDGKVIGIIRSGHIRDYYYMAAEAVSSQLESMLENVYEGVCTVDMNGIVNFWNSSAERIYGVHAEDIIGKPLADFFPNAIILKVLKTRETYTNVKHSPRENSEVMISARPLMYKGQMVGVISSERDISDIRLLQNKLQHNENAIQFLKDEVSKKVVSSTSGIIGKNPAFENVLKTAFQAASSNSAVMIAGESGTGKEVLARYMHNNSGRKGLFVPVNCSAIPTELFESEFFGYVAGAFTGAAKNGKAGFFELADGGTLFLDEIADLPLSMQAKLLRVLEDTIIRRLGSEKTRSVDVRIISATHKDLDAMTKSGEFREDLYYRLNVIQIKLPALRERKDDIILFLNSFISDISKKSGKGDMVVSPEALKILQNYPWKGNIRELRNCVEQMVVLNQDKEIKISDIPRHIVEYSLLAEGKKPKASGLEDSVAELEKNMITDALIACNYNKTRSAEKLGIKRTTLLYKIKTLNIATPE